MLYDLNIPWSEKSNDLQRTLTFLDELGYNVVALNHNISGAIPSKIVNPIPATPSFSLPNNMTLLRRCTLHISDPAQNYRLPQLATAYDMLALRPTTEKAFLAACLTLSEQSLISLDMTMRFPFHFRPKPLMAAVKRGIRFEICYAQALASADPNARRNFISNVLSMIRATNGRGLVLSSEAKSVLGLRAPADVLNLMNVWGLTRERGMEAMDVNPRGVVLNEGIKRKSFRGVVMVLDDGGEPPKEEQRRSGEQSKESTPAMLSDPDGSLKSKKRQHEGPSPDTKVPGDAAAPLSKRQAKKRRLEAMKEAMKANKPSVPDKTDSHPLFAGLQSGSKG